MYKLPVIYVCENNLYAISSALDVREPIQEHVSEKFETIVPTNIIDGNDVEAVASCVYSMVERVRSGNGPFFVECMTYRLKDHHNIGTGVERGYRTQGEWNLWNEKSPITRLEKKMRDKEWLNDSQIQRIEDEIQLEIDRAFYFARKSNLPGADTLLDYLWGK